MTTNTIPADEMTDEQMDAAHNLAGWKNNLYEAVMSDYSIESITRAERGRDAAEAELEALGVDHETAVVWSEDRGCWTLA